MSGPVRIQEQNRTEKRTRRTEGHKVHDTLHATAGGGVGEVGDYRLPKPSSLIIQPEPAEPHVTVSVTQLTLDEVLRRWSTTSLFSVSLEYLYVYAGTDSPATTVLGYKL